MMMMMIMVTVNNRSEQPPFCDAAAAIERGSFITADLLGNGNVLFLLCVVLTVFPSYFLLSFAPT